MKRYLITKLLAINLVVIGFVMIIIWVSIDTLAAGYFVTLMEKYHISPKPAHSMFVDAIHRYLIWSSIGAVFLAAILSYVMTRRALSPLIRMNIITRDIGAGNFDVRVPVNSKDEVGQLATAFNTMAENLNKVEMLRKKLMIDVAHELRTPLTNIRGYLEAIRDGVLPASSHNIALLQDETLRLTRLVEDVLELAHADAAYGRLDLESMDLVNMIETISETLFSGAMNSPTPKLHIHSEKKPVPIRIDPPRMNRVLKNLIENAFAYSPEEGDIDIRIQSLKQSVRVTFSNPTHDIHTEDLPYLFERFYRGEKSRSRDHGGAGIGLSIVKELIQAHGGTVGAHLDNGNIHIWFELPQNVSPPRE